MAARGRPIGVILSAVFALPFVAIGIFVAFAGLRGESGSNVFTVPFGLVFAGVGAWQIVKAVRGLRSPESQAPIQAHASRGLSDVLPQGIVDYRTAGRRPRTAGELYAPVLATAPLPQLNTTVGSTLPVALAMGSLTKGQIGLLVFSIVWMVFTVPFFVGFLQKPSAAVIVPLLFLAVGVAIFVSATKKILGRLKLPRVEVSEEPIYLGDDLRLHIEQRGPARIIRLQVAIICREHVQYTVGTDTRTEDHDVFTQELLDSGGENLRVGQRWPHDLHVTIPTDAPCSFFAPNNSVAWLVRVHAAIAGWPDFDETYELRVLPRPPS